MEYTEILKQLRNNRGLNKKRHSRAVKHKPKLLR